MPTKRPRHLVTETPALARRLDLAAARFPGRANSRGDLIVALTEVAEAALLAGADADDRRAAAKQRVLARTNEITPEAAAAMLAAREADWDQEDLY